MVLKKLGKPVGNLLLSSGSTPWIWKVQTNMQTTGKKWRESEGCCLCISMDTEHLTSPENKAWSAFIFIEIESWIYNLLFYELNSLDLYLLACARLLTSRHSYALVSWPLGTCMYSSPVVCNRLLTSRHLYVLVSSHMYLSPFVSALVCSFRPDRGRHPKADIIFPSF